MKCDVCGSDKGKEYTSEDDELVEQVRSTAEYGDNARLIEWCLGKLNVGNCGIDDYELAERVEDAIYKIRYGAFWKLVKPGQYLKDRQRYKNMQAVVDHKPLPFPE